jgi:hypothetical protein
VVPIGIVSKNISSVLLKGAVQKAQLLLKEHSYNSFAQLSCTYELQLAHPYSTVKRGYNCYYLVLINLISDAI